MVKTSHFTVPKKSTFIILYYEITQLIQEYSGYIPAIFNLMFRKKLGNNSGEKPSEYSTSREYSANIVRTSHNR